MPKRMDNFKLNSWLSAFLAVVILNSLAAAVIISVRANIALNRQIAAAKEAARPADIDIIVLKDGTCQDCFDIFSLLKNIKAENVKVNSEAVIDIASDEGREIIKKFNIMKAPSLIIRGEVEKNSSLKELWPKIGEIKEGAFVLRQVSPPYTLVSTGEIKGRINFTALNDKNCLECYDVFIHQKILGQFGVKPFDSRSFDIASAEGKKLISQYNIQLTPTIILSGDAAEHPALKKAWAAVGTVEQDGAYVFREGVKNMGTYRDLKTYKIIKPEAKP